MVTKYVDIDDSYIATGDGTEGSPLNTIDFLQHVRDLNEDCDYYLKGTLVDDSEFYCWIYPRTNLDHHITFRLLPWSPETNGPWIMDPYSGDIRFNCGGYADMIIKGGVIGGPDHVAAIEILAMSSSEILSPPEHAAVVNDCYIQGVVLYLDSQANNDLSSIKIQGSTIRMVEGWGQLTLGDGGVQTYKTQASFIDCYFDLFPEGFFIDVIKGRTNFERCIFESSSDYEIFDDDMGGE